VLLHAQAGEADEQAGWKTHLVVAVRARGSLVDDRPQLVAYDDSHDRLGITDRAAIGHEDEGFVHGRTTLTTGQLTPPFDTMPQDPGYIKGYLPGVRENGAQYTHAALWAVLATALRGEGERAFELYQLINPLTHASTAEQAASYKVEPYVVAADVDTAAGQVGRGGWTWYTGSASWMYRVGLESILGFTRRGNNLLITPRVPAQWQEYGIEYRFGGSTWAITVHDPARVAAHGAVVTVDGTQLPTAATPLVDDAARHEVTIRPRVPDSAPLG
jgi:cellobiose phosphorylase